MLSRLVVALVLANAGSRADDSGVQPEARHVLEGMVHAYADVHRLEQETTYHGSGVSGGMLRSRLVVQKPNKLFLEVLQSAPEQPAPMLSRFVSDGKWFYAYQAKNGWFTKEKAPKNLKEFDFLALSVEMSAITGNDPVASLIKQARSVHLANPEVIDGDMAEVVVLDTSSPAASGELRLFVGRRDHLLRRFAMESRPIERPPDPKAPPLEPGESVAPPPQPTSFSYDVHVMTGSEQTKDAFTWVAPAGSFPYQRFPSMLDPKTGKQSKIDPAASMPPGVTPMKIISIQELMKNAKKPNKK